MPRWVDGLGKGLSSGGDVFLRLQLWSSLVAVIVIVITLLSILEIISLFDGGAP